MTQRCLNGRIIDISRFFDGDRCPIAFPWDLMGLSRPKIGTLHGYLGRALAKFCTNGTEQLVLVGNPSLGQITLISEALAQGDFKGVTMCAFIKGWCESVGMDSSKMSLEQKVLYVLKNCPKFVEHFDKEITQLWLSGSIDLDPEYFKEPLRSWNDRNSKKQDFDF